ncbi:hypothetical protein LTR09_011880 [Extremus antarcticus]|uniref:Uncharacterized protein n=1 Tax=Extremus antarcticus TaxID=702011 RepID=A0AAJ0D5P7_9PEZI|nr:hypothetical protein LTR09_011880 [Extremus antarcticus]
MATTSPLNRLFALPRELRDQIYTYVVTPKFTPVTPAKYVRCPWFDHTIRANYIQPAICRASRQLRLETLPIYYSSHIFSIDLYRSNRANATFWLTKIGDENARHLQRLELVSTTVARIHTKMSSYTTSVDIVGNFDVKGGGVKFAAYSWLRNKPEILDDAGDVRRVKEAEDVLRRALEEKFPDGLPRTVSGLTWLMERFSDFCESTAENPLRALNIF